MNGEDTISLGFILKRSVCRMYIEMPYKTKQTHKVARTQSISQFLPSEMGAQTQNTEMVKDRADLLN